MIIDLAGTFRAEVPYFAVFVDYDTRMLASGWQRLL
jgi:hypothetical protein